jgi:hypothetical protein
MISPAPELCPNGFCIPATAPADTPVSVPVLEGDPEWGGRIDLVPPGAERPLLGGVLQFHPSYADLHLGYQDDAETVSFAGLTFGASLWHNGAEIASEAFPPPGVTYVSTDPSQQWIEVVRFEYEVGQEYEVVIWTEESGRRYETRWNFVAPTPAAWEAP